MNGVLTKGIELGYKTSGAGETYTKVAGLQSIPDIGGAPEQLDITTFDDTMMHYMNGLKDVGSMEFTFLYDKQDNASSNFQTLCGLGFPLLNLKVPRLINPEICPDVPSVAKFKYASDINFIFSLSSILITLILYHLYLIIHIMCSYVLALLLCFLL